MFYFSHFVDKQQILVRPEWSRRGLQHRL